MRSKPSLQKIDLQMLFEHPTVRSLAACLSEQSADSDSEEEVILETNTLLDSFLQVVKEHPHAICLEVNQQSMSYLQLQRQMMAYPTPCCTKQNLPEGSTVAIFLDSMDQYGCHAGSLREGCVLQLSGRGFCRADQGVEA